jgi:hypothetical protein
VESNICEMAFFRRRNCVWYYDVELLFDSANDKTEDELVVEIETDRTTPFAFLERSTVEEVSASIQSSQAKLSCDFA